MRQNDMNRSLSLLAEAPMNEWLMLEAESGA